MEIKFLILFSVLVFNVNSQIDGLGKANTCATRTLGDTLPNKKEICWGDLSNPTTRCCFVTTKSNDVDINICSAIPKGSNIDDIRDQIKKFGLDSQIECSAVFTKFSIVMMIFYGLFVLFF